MIGRLQYVSSLWQVPIDAIAHLRNEAHRSHLRTYVILRKAYVISHGVSRELIRLIFRLARPISKSEAGAHTPIIRALRTDGIVTIPQFISRPEVNILKAYLGDQEGYTISETGARRYGRMGTLQGSPSFRYTSEVTLRCPTVRAILERPIIREIAAAYLGCVPIFTGAASWWSIADFSASKSELGWSAQLYHYDHDYPAFLKFFIYLTDVTSENGPFTFVKGTHRKKVDWTDGRRSERV